MSYMISITFVIATILTTVYSGHPLDELLGEHQTRHSYVDIFRNIDRLSKQEHSQEDADIQKGFSKFISTLYNPSQHLSEGLTGDGMPQNLLGDTADVNSRVLQAVMMSALESAKAKNYSTSTCVNDTGRLLIGIFNRESWAMKFLDAAGKPGPGISQFRFNFVGDYDLCRAADAPAQAGGGQNGFKGHYCTLKAALGPSNPTTQGNVIQLGACMPDTCDFMELTGFVYEALQKLGLNKTLSVNYAECHEGKTEMTAATIMSIIVVTVICFLMIVGTFYDVVFIQLPKWRTTAAEEAGLLTNGLNPDPLTYAPIGEENGDAHSSSEKTSLLHKPQQSSSSVSDILSKSLIAFSVYTNGSKALNTYQPPGSLGAIHGIRFLSMSWVILGHLYAFGISYQVNAATAYQTVTKRWTFDAVGNALVSVDTFFTLSGLLTAYLTMKEMKRKSWKINWGLFYFHRFWRLTPPYMLTLLIALGFSQYLGSGAMWSDVQPADKQNCENYWWANLLYVNNLVDSEKICFGHSWYLSNDMQFFIISPLMLIPFYFNVYLGLGVCMFLLALFFAITGGLSASNNWPDTFITLNPNTDGMMDYMMHYYFKPWCRIAPYIVGVMAGVLLARTNGGQGIRMKRYVAALGWIVAIAVGLATVYGLHGDISGDSYSSTSVAALYNAVGRAAWGAAVCWVIVACVSGYGGFVNTLLSWSPFVALGRLTYMAYLVHPSLLYVYFQSQGQLLYLSDVNIAVTFCGALVIVNMVAFVLMLGFESPMIGLEKTFLRKGR